MDGETRSVAVGELTGQVFLDDHLPIEAGVARQVGDAKTTAAKHTLDDKLLDARADRQFLAAGTKRII